MSFGSFGQNFTEMNYDQLTAIATGQLLINKKVVPKRDKLKCIDILKIRNQVLLDQYEVLFIAKQKAKQNLRDLQRQILMLENQQTALRQLAIEVTHSSD